jgi:hypothetical protein
MQVLLVVAAIAGKKTMNLKTVDELQAFRDREEKKHKQATGETKAWGDKDIPVDRPA